MGYKFNPFTANLDIAGSATAAGGSTGQVQYNNGGVFGGIPGSSVLAAPSAGSVGLVALALGGATALALTSPYRLQVRGGMLGTDSSGLRQWINVDGSSFQFGDLSGLITGGFLSVISTGTYLLGGSQQVLLTTNAGASIALSGSDGSVFISNSAYSNFINVDGSGGVSLRATGDTGGLYADSSGYTYLGNFSNTACAVLDSNGGMTIAASNALPNGTALLQVGPDYSTGAIWSFNAQNYGSQAFFDIISGVNGVSASIRVFTDVQCGEFAAVGGAGEYFSNTNAGDTALKGDPGGGNAFRIGVGSGDSQISVTSSGLLVSNLTAGRVTFAGTSGLLSDNAGLTYVSGTGLKLNTVGEGIRIKEGTNATMGRAVLVAGAVTVSTTKVTSTCEIFITSRIAGGTRGDVQIGTVTAGTSFQIISSLAGDTSTVSWLIIEPS